MLNLRIPRISGMKDDQVHGLLLSFLSAATEVTEGRRKISYLSHFYRERLNRFEKKKLLFLLETLISQLSKSEMKSHVDLIASSDPTTGIPKEFKDYFLFFKRQIE
jgi:hypothetical protein